MVLPLKVRKHNYIKVFERFHFLNGFLKDGQTQRSLRMFMCNGHNIGLFAIQSKLHSIYLDSKGYTLYIAHRVEYMSNTLHL